MDKWKLIKSETIFENKFFKLLKDTIEVPTKDTVEWFYTTSNDSVMVVGMTKDHKLVLVRQYRYFIDDDSLEFPAGLIEDNEHVEDSARREFEEESGYKCNKLIKLGSFHETVNRLKRQIHIYFTDDVEPSEQNLDSGDRGFEEIEVELIDFDEAVKMVLDNKIIVAGTALAILLLKEKVDKGEIKT